MTGFEYFLKRALILDNVFDVNAAGTVIRFGFKFGNQPAVWLSITGVSGLNVSHIRTNQLHLTVIGTQTRRRDVNRTE
jgi:hypothetical protein